MASYRLSFKKSVAKDLRTIPNKDVKRLLVLIEKLCDNPRADGCSKLSGQERYRIRLGIYRVIYEIEDTQLIIQVVKIGRRKDVYR